MDGDFSAAAVIGEVMGKAEGFFTEGGGKFLLLFDFLLVKDAPKLVQRVRCIAAQGRDFLRGIVANLNRARRNSGFRRAVRIALGRHGEAGGEAYGVVDLVLLLLAHLVIAAVVVVGRPDAFRAVVRTVLQIAERERPRAEAILLRSCFAGDDRALEVGVLFDVDVEAAFSSEDAGLSSCASIVGVDRSSAREKAERGLGEFSRANIPREIEACRCVLLLVGFFFLQGLDVEIAADLCRDLVALYCAAEDVRILAAFDLQGVFRGDLRRGVGRGIFLAVSLCLARA